MYIIHGSKMQYAPLKLSHRGKGLEFKTFFRGTEGTPENYWFTLAHQENFYSPPHKHNFDQFRLAWSGTVSISQHITLQPGQLCYHPEGVTYGPQDDGPGPREVLVLQFGGASGQGFLSSKQMEAANAKLSEQGKFEKGRYHVDGAPEEGKDGFEALWEECNSPKKLVYPEGRYTYPVVMEPKAFGWKKQNRASTPSIIATGAVHKKTLGVFSERETTVEIWKIESDGKLEIKGRGAIQLCFVLRGQGEASGEHLETESAMRLQPWQSATLTTESEIEVLRLVLPLLSEAEETNGHAEAANGSA